MSTDQIREVAEILFGGGGDELIEKMNPTQSDLATKDKRRRAMTAGLSAVGGAAGAAGLGLAAHKTRGAFRVARYGSETLKAAKVARKVGNAAPKLQPIASRGTALKSAVKEEKGAAGLLPLEVAGLGGEVMATHILHGDTKKKTPTTVAKGNMTDIVTQAGPIPTKRSVTRAVLTNPKVQQKGIETTRKGAGMLRKLPSGRVGTADVDKRAPVVWEGEFAKVDADKQQVFGWASVIEMNGEPVVDLQGDVISPDEMEKAAYSYVQKSRKGGDMHLRDNWAPIQKSEMIESFIVTDEKRQAMGLPDSVPTGWWVGFQVQDPQVWADIKAGKRTGFSIHGHGRRSDG